MNPVGREARAAQVLSMLTAGGPEPNDPLIERALPQLARGRDVVLLTGCAEKQLAGLVAPALLTLARAGKGPTALLLPADKEVASAAMRSLQGLASARPAKLLALSEEHALRREAQDLGQRPDVIVALPARLIDHLRRGHLSLAGVRCAVILEGPDEGRPEFRRDVQFITSKLPRRRQTIVMAAGLSRESAASIYPLRRPVFIEQADLDPPPAVAPPPPKKAGQEKPRVSNAAASGTAAETRKDAPMPDEKLMAQALESILKAIHQQESPDELNRVRKVFKRHVPIFMRSYVAAYLFKKSQDGFVGKPLDTTTLFVSIGKNRSVFPKDLLKLFMSRLGVERSEIGEVKVLESYSFVDVSLDRAQEAISKLSGVNFRGRRLTVNLARKKGEGKE